MRNYDDFDPDNVEWECRDQDWADKEADAYYEQLEADSEDRWLDDNNDFFDTKDYIPAEEIEIFGSAQAAMEYLEEVGEEFYRQYCNTYWMMNDKFVKRDCGPVVKESDLFADISVDNLRKPHEYHY